MRKFIEKLYLRYISFDPGLIRLEKAALATFSFLSAWIITREILQVFAVHLSTPVYLKLVLFAPILSLICSLIITDLHSADRRTTLGLSILPIAAILASFTLLPNIPLLYGFILLVLFFFSYYFRRYGARSMELFLLATIAFYFSAVLKINLEVLPWFLMATLIGIFSVFLWRFVLLPYNPEHQLHRTNATYYRQASMIVREIIQTLQRTPRPLDWKKRLDTGLKKISHCRRVIESELAALTPPVWTIARINRLRINFYNAEQGITLMIDSLPALVANSDKIPTDLGQTVSRTLDEFQQVLFKVASSQSVANLEKQISLLRSSVDSRVGEISSTTWALPLLRLLAGGAQLNQAVKDVRNIESDRGIPISEESRSFKPATGSNKKPPSIGSTIQSSTGLGRIQLKSLHPTTILGLQAFLAVLLAMLVAYFLSLDHSNWVFWTAFTVIAGSTGESLRRMSFRVAGTVIGVLIGILISILLVSLSAGSLPVIGLVAACLFLAAYFVDTSYVWMIFWINIAVTLLFIGLGGTVGDILVNRPLNTFIGACIAALVVMFVLPVRTRDRFKRALAGFMKMLDQFLASYTGKLTGKTESSDIDTAGIQLNAAFAQLEQTFPSMALEYNPLARAQNPLLELSTTLQSLKTDLLHMAQNIKGEPTQPIRGEGADLVSAIQERIHFNIESIIGLLNQKPAEEVRLLTDLFSRANQVQLLEQALKPDIDENAASETYVLIHLARVNQALSQVASGISSN